MFFGVRILLAMTSGLAEAAFYRAVVDNISMKVGRYLFFMLAFSAGMWNSSAGTKISSLVNLPV
jgi:alpha-1,2-mannosyltransferase